MQIVKYKYKMFVIFCKTYINDDNIYLYNIFNIFLLKLYLFCISCTYYIFVFQNILINDYGQVNF